MAAAEKLKKKQMEYPKNSVNKPKQAADVNFPSRVPVKGSCFGGLM